MQYLFVLILILVAAQISAKNKKKQTPANRNPGAAPGVPVQAKENAQAVRTAPQAAPVHSISPQPAPVAPASQTPPVFVSLEGRAKETLWHDAVMGEEGEDSCHDEMYMAGRPAVEETEPMDEETAREWARAVVMAEIMKRPRERRRMPGGR